MTSRLKKYRLDEIAGSDFASLSAAHQACTDEFTRLLTQRIHALLQNGDLTIEDGVIVPAKSREKI